MAPRILSTGGEYKAIENTSLILECQAEGSPPPTIEWKKDGHVLNSQHSIMTDGSIQLLSAGQQLRIQQVNANHQGTYSCSAKNKVSTTGLNFRVNIILRPLLSDAAFERAIEVVEGEDASFTCPVKQATFNG